MFKKRSHEINQDQITFNDIKYTLLFWTLLGLAILVYTIL